MIYMNPDNYITVGELKKYLEDLPDETMFIMSSDGEGNSYSPLAGMDLVTYVPESTWGGYIWSDDDEYEDDAQPPDDAVESIVLWPVN